MDIKKAKLKSFDETNYKASVQIDGSYKSYLEGITVARNLPPEAMIPGKEVLVVFTDEYNPKEAVLTAIYSD